MNCPKCKAKIGVIEQHFFTDSGEIAGVLCYMCGYWVQLHPARANE
jgi:hypothetical protein